MYGKAFESMYEGSMFGAGLEVWGVWNYVITKTHFEVVELNPKHLAAVLGCTPEQVDRGIAKLCAPDPESRSKVEEGRRLVREGQFQYRVVNWAHYQSIRNENERREYNRIKMAEYRARKKGPTKSQLRQVRARADSRETRFVEADKNGHTDLSDKIAAEGLPGEL